MKDIYIIIHGETCSSKPILLKQARGSFEQGSKCEFRINHRNCGKIKSIVIGYGPDGEALLTGEGRVPRTDTRNESRYISL